MDFGDRRRAAYPDGGFALVVLRGDRVAVTRPFGLCPEAYPAISCSRVVWVGEASGPGHMMRTTFTLVQVSGHLRRAVIEAAQERLVDRPRQR